MLTEKAAELERANQYKSEFLANMCHELRTPLNSSLILSKLLADNKAGNLTDEQVKFAQTISSAGNDLLALINDILDLSKIEAGKVEVSPEPVLIARTVESLVKTFQAGAQEKGIAFSATVEPGTPERIETDAQRLGQILKNLLSNALKFTEKGQVSLRVYSAAEGTVSFAVRDTGIGIPPHQHRHHLRGVPAGGRQHPPQVRRHRPRALDLARPGAPARRRHQGCRARRTTAARSR